MDLGPNFIQDELTTGALADKTPFLTKCTHTKSFGGDVSTGEKASQLDPLHLHLSNCLKILLKN